MAKAKEAWADGKQITDTTQFPVTGYGDEEVVFHAEALPENAVVSFRENKGTRFVRAARTFWRPQGEMTLLPRSPQRRLFERLGAVVASLPAETRP